MIVFTFIASPVKNSFTHKSRRLFIFERLIASLDCKIISSSYTKHHQPIKF